MSPPTEAIVEPEPADGSPAWPWLIGLSALLAAGGAFWWRRRSDRAIEAPHFAGDEPRPTPPIEPSPPATLPKRSIAGTAIPEPALSLADAPASASVPPAQATPGATPRTAGGHIAVSLTARRLSATLMNTALTYELSILNTGPDPIGPIAVSGDMIGAHASIPPRILLETAADGEPHHRIPRLDPGESATMSGELRLPLAAITPIRHGAATLFVPLARFRLLVFREGRPPVSANHAFVIGEDPQNPGAALKPFRLDLGPRLYSGITQRELALPA
jgi:hypothetical protein